MNFTRLPLVFAFLFGIALIFSACTSDGTNPAAPAADAFSDFRGIPGISYAQISAIENLLTEHDYFIYGMTQNAEAFFSADGEILGFTKHMTEWLSGLFGVPFVPQIFLKNEIFDGMEDGSIHFTGQLARQSERERLFRMSTPIVSRRLMTVRADTSYRPAEIAAAGGVPRFVFYADTVTPDILYDAGTYLAFEELLVDTAEEVAAMLRGGYADAFVGDASQAWEIAYAHADLIFEEMYPLVIRTASFSARDERLFPIVDAVQLALDGGAMPLLGEFYAQGARDVDKMRMQALLTDEERAFLAENPVINVGVRSLVYPTSFFNSRENEFQGIAHDVLREAEYLLGVEFNILHETPLERAELQFMLRRGDAMMIVGTIPPTIYADEFLYSDYVVEDNFAILSATDFPAIGIDEVMYFRVGVVAASAYETIFLAWFPDHMSVQGFRDMPEMIDALEAGEIDLIFSSRSGLLGAINYYERVGVRVNISFEETYGVNFAIGTGLYPLQSALNKALYIINTDFITDYWRTRTFDHTVQLMAAEVALRNQQLVGGTIIVVLVLALALLMYSQSKRERKILTEAIARRTRMLEMEKFTMNTLFDTIPDLIFCKDLEHRHTRVNQRFLDFFGLKRDDVIGKNEYEFLDVPPEVINGFHTDDRGVMDNRTMCFVEDVIPAKTGEKRIFDTIKVPMIVDGKVIGLLGVARDITSRKAMEQEITNASRAKTAFIANMSHEIRTPMNSIVGFSELALGEELSSKTRTYLLNIIDSSNWLLQIINDILDISKIESGKMELAQEKFRLTDVFESCKAQIQAKAKEKGIELHFYAESCPDNRLLVGDPFRLRQIFSNLLTNAVKFTSEGVIRVNSVIKSSTDRAVTFLCEIQDTGIGMTEEEIARVSEPFMQADVSITRKYGGTGLGLPIVTRLIETMGGQLKIESEVGKGSAFSFELTFLTAEESAREDKVSSLMGSAKPIFTGEILVCEDNLMNQMVIAEHLERIGIGVVVAENGKVGVQKVQERMDEGGKPFALILMDIHMPIMDGIDAATKIAEMGCTTPIVALTANVMYSDCESYKLYGMEDCIGKPFSSHELWKVLLKHMTPVSWSDTNAFTEYNENERERELVKKLKKSFVHENQKKYAEIKAHIESGNTDAAHRFAHTLKSSAGLLGKTALQNIAAEVETLLHAEEEVPKEKLDKLKKEMDAALAEFQPIAAEREAAGETITDPAAIREILDTLEPLIKRRSPDSLEFLSRLRAIEGAEELTAQVEAYDFKPAAETLAKLRNIWRES